MEQWITYFIALFLTMVEWMGNQTILGVSVLWIIIASFILGVMLRVLIFKP